LITNPDKRSSGLKKKLQTVTKKQKIILTQKQTKVVRKTTMITPDEDQQNTQLDADLKTQMDLTRIDNALEAALSAAAAANGFGDHWPDDEAKIEEKFQADFDAVTDGRSLDDMTPGESATRAWESERNLELNSSLSDSLNNDMNGAMDYREQVHADAMETLSDQMVPHAVSASADQAFNNTLNDTGDLTAATEAEAAAYENWEPVRNGEVPLAEAIYQGHMDASRSEGIDSQIQNAGFEPKEPQFGKSDLTPEERDQMREQKAAEQQQNHNKEHGRNNDNDCSMSI
jgi:hypothetical protein